MHHIKQKGHTVLWLRSLALQSGHRFRAVCVIQSELVLQMQGPEPEAIDTGVVGHKTYAFIGLERNSGIFVYDISQTGHSKLRPVCGPQRVFKRW